MDYGKGQEDMNALYILEVLFLVAQRQRHNCSKNGWKKWAPASWLSTTWMNVVWVKAEPSCKY